MATPPFPGPSEPGPVHWPPARHPVWRRPHQARAAWYHQRIRPARKASRLAARGATQVAVLYQEGLDHYGVAMRDPEGNEFDIN